MHCTDWLLALALSMRQRVMGRGDFEGVILEVFDSGEFLVLSRSWVSAYTLNGREAAFQT